MDGILEGFYLIASHWRSWKREQKYGTILIAAFFTGIALSIIFGGNAQLHYLIQLIPFISLVAGFFFSFLLQKLNKIPLMILLFIGLAVPAKSVLDQYLSIAEKLAKHEPLQSDIGYQLASYIYKENPSGQPFYMMTEHIVHWLTGTKPIAKSVTHPSTLGKEYLLKVFLLRCFDGE